MKRLIADIDKCTGCSMCMLACSMEQQKAFNPRYSKVRVDLELSGNIKKVEFSDQCDVKLTNQCVLHNESVSTGLIFPSFDR